MSHRYAQLEKTSKHKQKSSSKSRVKPFEDGGVGVCVRVCACVCVRACVRVCVCVCVFVLAVNYYFVLFYKLIRNIPGLCHRS